MLLLFVVVVVVKSALSCGTRTKRRRKRRKRKRKKKRNARSLALYSQRLNFQPIIRSARNRVRVLRVVDELLESSLQTLDDVNVLKIEEEGEEEEEFDKLSISSLSYLYESRVSLNDKDEEKSSLSSS